MQSTFSSLFLSHSHIPTPSHSSFPNPPLSQVHLASSSPPLLPLPPHSPTTSSTPMLPVTPHPSTTVSFAPLPCLATPLTPFAPLASYPHISQNLSPSSVTHTNLAISPRSQHSHAHLHALPTHFTHAPASNPLGDGTFHSASLPKLHETLQQFFIPLPSSSQRVLGRLSVSFPSHATHSLVLFQESI